MFTILIFNYRPGRLAYFRKVVLAVTALEFLFIVDIIIDLFRLKISIFRYVYHIMTIFTIIGLWGAYVHMKRKVAEE